MPWKHHRNEQPGLGGNQDTEPVWGTWVAQRVTRLTLDFGSGHNLTVPDFEPRVRLCTDSVESTWNSVSLSLCPSPAHSLSLSPNKQINKHTLKT